MKRYDTYKDSGVQWLGEIPGHWERTRLKNVMKLLNGRAYLQPELQEIGKYRILRVGNFFTNDRWYYSDMELEPDKYCNKGDLLFAWSASFGPYIWNEEKAIYHYHIWKVLLGERYDKLYAYYMFLAFSEVKRRDVHGSTMVHLTLQNMNQSYIPLPPLSEQRSIVSYLDDKCGKIDEWVTKKQKEVEHLQELKQRVIADAVTRGLNPHVKMKATNIPWLKEIPEHWECIRLTTCILSSVVGSWGVDEKKDGTDILCLRVADFDYNKGIIKEDKLTYRNYEGKLSEEKFFRDGDLLLEKSGGGDIYPVGRVVRFSLNGRIATCSNFIQKLTPNSEIVSSDYLYFWFKMIYSLKINGMYFNQTTGIQNLKVNEYLKQMIYLPPLSEQKQIVSYLNAKCSKIDKLIANITKEIECIKEYKQRLISDVVTGQIKVC